MNNEPVAFVDEIWITRPDLAKNIGIENMFMRSAIGVKNYIPLYTHPVKELTDEEIQAVIDNWDFGLDISPKEHIFLLCKTVLEK